MLENDQPKPSADWQSADRVAMTATVAGFIIFTNIWWDLAYANFWECIRH